MLKISKLAEYAVIILGTLSLSDEIVLPTTTLAQRTHLQEPTVSKIMKLLSKAGIVTSVRGATGGYKMARSAQDITVAEIITALDGPIALTACADDENDTCAISHQCAISGRWTNVNNAVKNALQSVTLAEMAPKQIIRPEGQAHVRNS